MMKFFLLSACALIVIASIVGLNIPLRIALVANAIIIIIDIIIKIRRRNNGKSRKEKNKDIDSSKKPI